MEDLPAGDKMLLVSQHYYLFSRRIIVVCDLRILHFHPLISGYVQGKGNWCTSVMAPGLTFQPTLLVHIYKCAGARQYCKAMQVL